MFVKITHAKNHEYASLVESYREEGTVKHRVLFRLGRKDEIEGNPQFQKIARKLMELSQASPPTDLSTLSEGELTSYGYIVYQKLWKQFTLPSICSRLSRSRNIQFDLNASLFLMVCQHLLSPRSKLSTYPHQHQLTDYPLVTLNSLYRTLDILAEEKELIEEELFTTRKNLFNLSVDVVFYDVTTFSFESGKEDGLRAFGYSKDGKAGEVQVVLGLFIDQEGCPIGYDLFPGNTFDGKTMEGALALLEKRFGIRRVIIVADRGLNSKLNLEAIIQKGYRYIVASRLKTLPSDLTEKILSPEGYTEIPSSEGNQTQEEGFRYQVFDYARVVKAGKKPVTLSERLIVTYSPRRARKDAADRERLVQKAQRLLDNPSALTASSKRGGKKYLASLKEEPREWTLNQELIDHDTRFDGYYGIETSEKNLSPQEVIKAYHTLWIIEESFRIMKSTREVRPIFHWTPRRIRGRSSKFLPRKISPPSVSLN
ncbi:MAG: IS1634 family transposase [Candidatus Atribacteria bacterium]|nr:IS1634 family transposase [Candidatus Atribacteria bacterium]